MTDTDTCDVCGVDKPAALVDETTVRTIAPMEATICETCRHAQDHELPDDICMQCGDTIGAGFSIEIEFPLGVAELPGRLSGTLCGDCAGWIAHDINYGGLHADEETNERHLELIKEQERAADA